MLPTAKHKRRWQNNERLWSKGGITLTADTRSRRQTFSQCHFAQHKDYTDWPGNEHRSTRKIGQLAVWDVAQDAYEVESWFQIVP